MSAAGQLSRRAWRGRRGNLARQVRTRVAPRLLPRLFSSDRLRRLMFRTVSQTAINYRHSALSVGRAGSVHAGDRLPWVPPADGGGDNFVPLATVAWQVHLYGETLAAQNVGASCAHLGLPLHTFRCDAATERAGLQRDTLYLVRPDG